MEVDPYDSGEALFAFDEDLRLVAWNEEAERLTGFAAGEALGRFCWEVLDGVDEQGLRVCRPDCGYARLMMAGAAPRGPRVRIRTKSGLRRRVSFSLLSVRAGEPPRFLHLVNVEDDPGAPAEEDPGDVDVRLSARQLEVLDLAGTGMTAVAVGEALGIAETTVRNHLRVAQFKLGCATKAEAVSRARALGLRAVARERRNLGA